MEGSLTHHHARVVWEGSQEDLRAHRVEIASQSLEGSSAPGLGGDAEKADPEEMFVASLSACHMLWFLALARGRRLRVSSYVDEPVGTLDGERITHVELRPRIELAEDTGPELLAELHDEAHRRCFLANSVNCTVEIGAPVGEERG